MINGQFYILYRVLGGCCHGERTKVDGSLRADLQRNSRIGATAVFPIKPGHAIRAGYHTGIATSSGGDYDSYILNYFFIW